MKSGQRLSIENLHVRTLGGKKILRGVGLVINVGEIHAVMGPNGSGKSTLAQVLMGHPGYKIIRGRIMLNGKDITKMQPDLRAKEGLFLGFQYPVEVAGVNYAGFLRTAVNEKLKKGDKVSPITFRNELSRKSKRFLFSDNITVRNLNEGFSGGEKKKSEILQMATLKPKYAILDEPDSGLDVDALKHIAKEIVSLKSSTGLVIITHYQRILNHIIPDHVHILIDGKVIKSGNAKLVKDIEKSGYDKYSNKS